MRLTLAAMGTGSYDVGTGSGSITLELPADASARVEAESGGGRVRVDVEDADYHRRQYDEVAFEIGGGEAMVRLETGSGGVRIYQFD